MKPTKPLWFAVETAFADVEELCLEARAAELALERKKQEEAAIRSLARGPAAVVVAAGKPAAGDRYARAADLAERLELQQRYPNGADLVELRERVRKRLVWLKGQLAEALSEHEVHQVLFPIVIHFDELVRLVSREAATRWEPLQSELYDVENGGELFYEQLEERLRRTDTAPIVLEVFYFCLRDGFQGVHQGDPKKIAEYEARLAERIPKAPVEDEDDGPEAAPVELVSFPYAYYAAAIGAVVGLYAMLRTLGAWL